MSRVTETDIAEATLRIAAEELDGIARFRHLKRKIPQYLPLSIHNKIKSKTRPGEEMWEQQIRNIKSHHASPGNYIADGYLQHVPGVGYRITDRGRLRIDHR
jgi:hypothetical protein